MFLAGLRSCCMHSVEPEDNIPKCSARQRWNESFRMSRMRPIVSYLQDYSAHAFFFKKKKKKLTDIAHSITNHVWCLSSNPNGQPT